MMSVISEIVQSLMHIVVTAAMALMVYIVVATFCGR